MPLDTFFIPLAEKVVKSLKFAYIIQVRKPK